MKAYFNPYTLIFKRPGRTSRGVLHTKKTYFLFVEENNKIAIGECNLFKGLSADDKEDYEYKLQCVCNQINNGEEVSWAELRDFPSIQFGLEQIKYSLKAEKSSVLFESDFTKSKKGIKINGLIWMGDTDFMIKQIKEKLENNFRCIKIKIGTNWQQEKVILKDLRNQFAEETLEIRVDANGAFSAKEAPSVLEELALLKVHSIEQPIRQGQWKEMAELCRNTSVPIALDEELIGIFEKEEKQILLKEIKPQYIILKPALVGGFKGSQEWIDFAVNQNIGWWVTSALESNIGLNALAQWVATLNSPMPQGLGTGRLFTNNIEAPLEIKEDELWFVEK